MARNSIAWAVAAVVGAGAGAEYDPCSNPFHRYSNTFRPDNTFHFPADSQRLRPLPGARLSKTSKWQRSVSSSPLAFVFVRPFPRSRRRAHDIVTGRPLRMLNLHVWAEPLAAPFSATRFGAIARRTAPDSPVPIGRITSRNADLLPTHTIVDPVAIVLPARRTSSGAHDEDGQAGGPQKRSSRPYPPAYTCTLNRRFPSHRHSALVVRLKEPSTRRCGSRRSSSGDGGELLTRMLTTPGSALDRSKVISSTWLGMALIR